MADFKWHKVSEKERQEIKGQAKHLLEQFGSKLEEIKAKEEHFESVVSSSGTREEGNGWETDSEFRNLFLENAPFVEDDFLVAEKGGWKK